MQNKSEKTRNLASGRAHYTRANPDPNPSPLFENPNLIPRMIKRQESLVSPRPLFRFNSYPSEWLFIEDLPFDEYFGLSLFRTKSESALNDTVLDPKFTIELEVQRANLSIDQHLLNSPQSSLTTAKIPELSEAVSTTHSSPLFPSNFEVHSPPPLIPSLPYKPIIPHQSPITPSSPSTTASNPSSPIHALNPPRVMATWYAPLVLPQNLGAMPVDYQTKIPFFDATQTITA